MKKSTAILISVICFVAGAVVGFIFAPIKKGWYIGNNNGNNNANNNNDCLAKNMSDSDEDDDDDDYSEDISF